MRRPKLTEEDLPKVLSLLESYTFKAVALRFGYSALGGGSCVWGYLLKNGIDPSKYSHRRGKETVAKPTEENNGRPKCILEYWENGYLIKRYEARWGLF